jgi:UTP--glucose-1-phosphate uridylyltransferase
MNILGLRQTPEVQVGNFGTVAGVWIEDSRLLNITEFSEKPNIDYARQHLRVPGLPDHEYLTVFGQYIIMPEIFSILGDHITHNIRQNGEIQLTTAIDQLRKEMGFLGLIMDGVRFDIGQPQFYQNTIASFSQPKIEE